MFVRPSWRSSQEWGPGVRRRGVEAGRGAEGGGGARELVGARVGHGLHGAVRRVRAPALRPCRKINLFAAKMHTSISPRISIFRKFAKLWQMLESSFSAASKPIVASKNSFCSIFQDLQELRTFAPLQILKDGKTGLKIQQSW